MRQPGVLPAETTAQAAKLAACKDTSEREFISLERGTHAHADAFDATHKTEHRESLYPPTTATRVRAAAKKPV